MEPVRRHPRRPRRTSQDPAAGRPGHLQHRDRPPGRLLAPDRHLVAAPLRPRWPGRAAGSAPLGPTPDRPTRPPRRDPGRYAVAATPAPWGHALVMAAARRPARGQPQHRGTGVGRARPQAVADRDLQVLHRPAAGAKVRDVVGLYLDPPERAIVVWVDDKSQIQALDRTARTCRYARAAPSGAPTTPPGTGRPPCSPRWR